MRSLSNEADPEVLVLCLAEAVGACGERYFGEGEWYAPDFAYSSITTRAGAHLGSSNGHSIS